jgi:hypothetical protein
MTFPLSVGNILERRPSAEATAGAFALSVNGKIQAMLNNAIARATKRFIPTKDLILLFIIFIFYILKSLKFATKIIFSQTLCILSSYYFLYLIINYIIDIALAISLQVPFSPVVFFPAKYEINRFTSLIFLEIEVCHESSVVRHESLLDGNFSAEKFSILFKQICFISTIS